MFQLNHIINVLCNKGLSACPLFYFDNFKFTNKIYLLIQKGIDVNISFEQIYLSLKGTPFDSCRYFKIKKITIWFKNAHLTCIRIDDDGMSMINEPLPDYLTNGFSHNLNLVDFDERFMAFELSCEPVIGMDLIDGLLDELKVLENGFKIINNHDDNFKLIFFNSPNEQLGKIKRDRNIVETLIKNKLEQTNGRLKGIRSDYLKEGVNLLLTPMLYGFEEITSLEKHIKDSVLASPAVNSGCHRQGRDKVLNNSFNKMTSIDKFKMPSELQKALQLLQSFYDRVLVVNDIVDLSYFTLLNLKMFNQEDIERLLDFKRKLDSALKVVEKKTGALNSCNNFTPTISKVINDSSVNVKKNEPATIVQKQDNNINSGNAALNSSSTTIEAIFSKNQFEIQVKNINTFDAFDFELFNDKLIITINRSHVFYQHLYKNSSTEVKVAFNMMIGSICHLSHINISDKVRQQDKLFFSRWSEYLEDLLLGGN
ncbi:hypothetical protein [Shewanella sp. S1-49-MNA-CIBAN-0167]|uniref:hypothetical protein n=3 Tax=unclassified Shewanella TaxID=196818 RepID=UPI0033272B2C